MDLTQRFYLYQKYYTLLSQTTTIPSFLVMISVMIQLATRKENKLPNGSFNEDKTCFHQKKICGQGLTKILYSANVDESEWEEIFSTLLRFTVTHPPILIHPSCILLLALCQRWQWNGKEIASIRVH